MRFTACVDGVGLTRRIATAALEADGITVLDHGPLAGAIGGTRSVRPNPDVLVLICDLSRASEMTRLRTMRREVRNAGIVLIAAGNPRTGAREALNNGADGFLRERDVEGALPTVVRAVALGHLAVPRDLRRCVARPAFSHRERQVLSLMVRGLQNREIADHLFIAESTVKSHLGSSFEKLGVRSRKEAAGLLLDPAEGLRQLVIDDATRPATAR
jgi:two-component system, NarL family, nitrate/nitrite response regulator NarP